MRYSRPVRLIFGIIILIAFGWVAAQWMTHSVMSNDVGKAPAQPAAAAPAAPAAHAAPVQPAPAAKPAEAPKPAAEPAPAEAPAPAKEDAPAPEPSPAKPAEPEREAPATIFEELARYAEEDSKKDQ